VIINRPIRNNARNRGRCCVYTPAMHRHALSISSLVTLIAASAALLMPACSSTYRASEHHNDQLQTLGSLGNVHQLTGDLYSGAEPGDRSAYEDLQAMGIRTLISVDAIAPDASLAGEYNIRVIHLPIGYTGISEQRINELAFALQSSLKPVYLHCHQGKHRGPAALCAGALALGLITHDEAKAFMINAGTSSVYSGLWAAVENTEKHASIEPMPLHEQQPVRTISKTMSRIARNSTRVDSIVYPEAHRADPEPAYSPAVYAAQIHNLFRTLRTSDESREYGRVFMDDLDYAVQAASDLEQAFAKDDPSLVIDALDMLKNSCARCHDKL